MRSLIYVPVVHTAADMGTLASSVKRAYREQYGHDRWLAHTRKVREMWIGIRRRIEALDLNFRRMTVYQDGLPVCGKEQEIVRDLAARGNANHQLIVWLIGKGAQLMGTESPNLLLREYDLVKAQGVAGTSPSGAWAVEQRSILEERDRFIAGRIGDTLVSGETGILFMGLLHDVSRHLPADVEVHFLIHRLPFERNGACPNKSTTAGSRPSQSQERRRHE